MPLVSRDPGGWMSPKHMKTESYQRKPGQPRFSARTEPLAIPTIAPTGEPFMPGTRTSLIGIT